MVLGIWEITVMQEVLDYFVEAINSHKRGDIPAAVDNYNKVFHYASFVRDNEVQCMAAVCRKFLYYYYNGTRAGNTIDKNGELHVLRLLGQRGAKVIFDVGANIGYWALNAAAVNPEATIHSFEIFADTNAKFITNTASNNRIIANAFGLSDRDGVVQVQCADDVDSAHFTTVFSFANGREETCPVMRGDRYMADVGIDRIDFLKIDVEGGEYDVLSGFSGALDRGAIPVIQFEYGPASLDSRKLLKDYYTLLTSHGYLIGRLHSGGANFRPYSVEEENFVNANFIACLNSAEDLREALTLR